MIERPWHYGDPQGTHGPVTTGQLVKWLQTGALPPATPVWTEGWDQWYPARDVAELASAAWPGGRAPGAVAARPATRSAVAPEGQVPTGRPHSPGLAALSSVFVPGAGQAYNGQPAKALLFLLSAVLVLPWAWSVWDAWTVAGKLEAAGGRQGRGGPAWLLVQAWTAANLALFTLIGLTVAGKLR